MIDNAISSNNKIQDNLTIIITKVRSYKPEAGIMQ